MITTKRPVVTTLIIGADNIPSLQACIESKKAYAENHGYTFFEGGKRIWNKKKPIAWSMIPFLLKVCSSIPDGTLLWHSNMNVFITNKTLSLEEHLVPLLPDSKDILLSLDSYGNMNTGSMLCRNTPWFRQFLQQIDSLTQYTFHPEGESEAITVLYKNNPDVFAMIEVINEPTRMSSYICGLAGEPLWTPGNFSVQFTGVHDLSLMGNLIQECIECKIPRLT